MKTQRTSGVLLHPTSLPSEWGVGDFGPAAYEFIDFLHTSGQRIWQMLFCVWRKGMLLILMKILWQMQQLKSYLTNGKQKQKNFTRKVFSDNQ